MKDAMTDHKAEWVLVPRVATEAMCDATDCAPRLARATWEKMIAAAPAASEAQAAAEDRIIYGTSIMLDGKRIDPRTVQIDPAASVAEDGELPGMWSRSDFTGGDPDERSHSQRDNELERRDD